MSIGNKIYLKRELPNIELLNSFDGIATANIADCMDRTSALGTEIRLVSKPIHEINVGYALTVKAVSGDNLFIHACLEMAGENDFIVISNESNRNRALVGEIMMEYARCTKKIKGVILDGPIRDFHILQNSELPIYATGSTPNGPFKHGPGVINGPIAISGVSINPGDIIVADSDGVIAIPKNDAKEILEDSLILQAKDSSALEKARLGTSDKSWVAKQLTDIKTEVIDDYYRG